MSVAASRPLTPAQAVHQGRKMIAERRRQEDARKAAMRPEGGVEAEAGKPVSEKDQRVEVASNSPEIPGGSPAAVAPSVAPRVIPDLVEPTSTSPAVLRNRPRNMHAAMSVSPTSSEVPKTDTHPDGTWPLADLRSGQCRFACAADDAPRDQHRFCGGPVSWLRGKPTSWCADHLPRVMGAPGRSAGGMSVAQAQAAALRQESA